METEQIPISVEQVLKAQEVDMAILEGLDFQIGLTTEGYFLEVSAGTEISPAMLEALAYSLQQREKAQQIQLCLRQINRVIQELLARGFVSAALGSPHRYDLNTEDQINLQALISAGIDAEFRCKEPEADFKTYKKHTKAQLKKVFADGLAYKARVLNFFGKEKERLHACESLQAVQDFTIKALEDGHA
ncbi:hypothetical protein [Helicobacter bizzozeronii]|uniref:hypothetical protein n=1 Tax=Helicobacter bizzozeronii TaxID=56877 RepID=UPI000CEE15D7|nr:hypothetical protein [Helicobacter bizzozeronii]